MGHWWVTLTNQLYFVYVHLSTFSHRSACASVMSHLSSVSVPVMFYLCSVYISFSFCLRSSYIFSFLSTFSLCFSHIPVMSHLCCVFLWSPFCLRSYHAPVVFRLCSSYFSVCSGYVLSMFYLCPLVFAMLTFRLCFIYVLSMTCSFFYSIFVSAMFCLCSDSVLSMLCQRLIYHRF